MANHSDSSRTIPDKKATPDAECIRLWRALESIVGSHVRTLRRDPHAMSVEVIEVEGDPGDWPLITVAGKRQSWGYNNGEGARLADALNDVIEQDKAR